eukprot:scaffold49433_cov42-Prasinocladus_malaysianus.AAC.1
MHRPLQWGLTNPVPATALLESTGAMLEVVALALPIKTTTLDGLSHFCTTHHKPCDQPIEIKESAVPFESYGLAHLSVCCCNADAIGAGTGPAPVLNVGAVVFV